MYIGAASIILLTITIARTASSSTTAAKNSEELYCLIQLSTLLCMHISTFVVTNLTNGISPHQISQLVSQVSHGKID